MKKLVNAFDKISPIQKYFSHLYIGGMVPYEKKIYNEILKYSTLKKFSIKKPIKIKYEEMSTPAHQLELFLFFIRTNNIKKVLEIGSFVGNTTMQIASAIGKDAVVHTIEVGQEFADIANYNFKKNGFDNNIKLLFGSAGNEMKKLKKGYYDLIFIDGNKADYLEYAIEAEKLISKKGMIIIDDVFFHGDALNSYPKTDKGRGCKRLLEYYKNDQKYNKLLLPLSNGIMVLQKK